MAPPVPLLPLSLIGSLALSEVVLILAVALMVFGGRLPEVAMRGAAQVMRARKALTRMWREAGLEQELRRVQWEIESKMPREADYEVRYPTLPQGAPRTTAGAGGEDRREGSAGSEADGEPGGELDPAIGFGAPPGTVSRGPDPPPPSPELPPREQVEGGEADRREAT